jgi:hypothetical protein
MGLAGGWDADGCLDVWKGVNCAIRMSNSRAVNIRDIRGIAI